MKKYLLFFVLVIFNALKGDQEASNRPYTRYSPYKAYLIEMIPSEYYGSKGKGTVFYTPFGVKKDSLWRIDWYAHNVFIMNDGEHLVRFGPWASDERGYSDLVIAFYLKNHLLKEYKVKDLIKDFSTLSHSVSHYMWHAESTSVKTGFSDDFSKYTIVMSDKNVYEFSTTSGIILKHYIDEKAKNSRQILQEELDKQSTSGNIVKNKSKELSLFERYFKISGIEAFYGHVVGLYFDDRPEWSGYFTPLEKCRYPWECKIIFPIKKDSSLNIGLTPNDILESYKDFISSDVMKQFLNSSSKVYIRIRAAGDRLHWDTEEVKKSQNVLLSNGYKGTDFKKWINVIVDFDKGKMISFYRPLHSDYYVLSYLNDYPKIWRSKFQNLKERDLFSEYCWNNCTVLMNDGTLKTIRIR